MQQQISFDIEHPEEHGHNPVADTLPLSSDDLISQHYDQDFDSISDHPPPSPQIEEELYQSIDQIFEPLPEGGTSDRQEDQQQQRLKQQIEHFKDEIANLQQKIAERQVKNSDEGHQQREKGIEDLLAAKSWNEQVLSSQKEEIRAAIINVIGKEAVSVDLLLADQHSGKMVEEQLLEESVRLNALLHWTEVEIAKLNREVKQNGDELAVADVVTEETRSKHHLLFREIQEKKQRNERNNEKMAEMDMKIYELKQKIGAMPEGDHIESKGSELKNRWLILSKEKEKQFKRNILLQKSTQHSCSATNRLLLELKRQIQEVSVQIGQFDQNNLKMEEKSEALLSQFSRETNEMGRSKRYGKKTNSNHFFTQDQEIPVHTPSPYHLLGRKRNFSVQNRQHQVSQSQSKGINYELRAGSHDLSIPMQADLSADEQVITEVQKKLKECSTDGALRKQFKLKLPKTSEKNSKKYLDLSENCGPKDWNYSKLMFRKQSNQNKLSITERLMRIELLEREDRVHSHKLYSNKEKSFERESRKYLNALIGSQQTEEGSNRSNKSYNQPNMKGNQLKDIRFSSRPNVSDNSHSQNVVTEPLKHFSPNLEIFIDKAPSELPSIVSKEEELNSKEISLASEECSASDSRAIKKDKTSNPSFSKMSNLEGIVCPQNLFSSIQKKLTLRETQARQIFNLSQGENVKSQREPQDITSVEGSLLAVSQLSRQSSMLRKRREKKITDEYMKVLEERGRRILELDYEGD